ncbi:MAG TPA: transporter [Candidatus Methylomirabilis sp.]|nr:transporter [Candidatus Methylomirabilis sp.]
MAQKRIALRVLSAAGLVVLLTVRASAVAQELEPRAYTNAPVGLNFVLLGYAYSQGGVAFDPSVPLTDAAIRVDSAVFAYARSLDVAGMSGKFDIVLPYVWLSGSALYAGEPRARDVAGPADPRLRFAVNFYGSPALSMDEFASYRQDLIVGASLQVTVPAGQYDPDKLVNIGTNRWSIKPELGISKAAGRMTLELAAGVTYYTENDNFFGGSTLQEDPIYSIQGHFTYSFHNHAWAALDLTYYTGGRTTLDGVPGNDLEKNSRVGGTYAFPLDRHHSIKFYASTGVSTRTGTDFDIAGIAWQYRWGAGF